MLPIVARASETVLRIVPGTLREASYALGGSQWRTVLMVVLPTARSGLATAVVLAMARGIGETAPVLLVAGYSRVMNVNPFANWQTSLPLYTYDEIQSPETADHVRAFGAGFALIILVLILFTIARRIGGGAPGELTRRQRRRIARQDAAMQLEVREDGQDEEAAWLRDSRWPGDHRRGTRRGAGDGRARLRAVSPTVTASSSATPTATGSPTSTPTSTPTGTPSPTASATTPPPTPAPTPTPTKTPPPRSRRQADEAEAEAAQDDDPPGRDHRDRAAHVHPGNAETRTTRPRAR